MWPRGEGCNDSPPARVETEMEMVERGKERAMAMAVVVMAEGWGQAE